MLTGVALIYLCFCFAAVFFGSSILRLLSGLTGAFFIVYFLLVYRVRVWVPIVIALMMLGIAVLKMDSNVLASLFFVLSLFSSVCLAIVIRDYGLGRVLITTPLLLLSLFLLYLFVVLEFGPNEFNSVFEGYSRNGVGAVLLALCLGYVWYCYEKDLKPSLFLGALVLFLMFPLYGRANIIGGAVLFGLILHLKFGFVGLLFLGLLLSVGSVLGFDYISGYLSESTNFSSGLESLRSEMLKGYAEQTNLSSLFLGTELTAVESIVDHGGNAHNAFLRAHSYFGLVSFCVILAFSMAVALMLSNGHFVLAVIAIVFVARASLDIIYLGNIFDFLMVGPFLYFYRPVRSTVCL